MNVKEIIFDAKIKNDVELDTQVTAELRKEGLYRELMRMAQGLRHDAGYEPQEKVTLYIEANVEVQKLLEEQTQKFMKDVNVREINFLKSEKVDARTSENFDGGTVWAGVSR